MDSREQGLGALTEVKDLQLVSRRSGEQQECDTRMACWGGGAKDSVVKMEEGRKWRRREQNNNKISTSTVKVHVM